MNTKTPDGASTPAPRTRARKTPAAAAPAAPGAQPATSRSTVRAKSPARSGVKAPARSAAKAPAKAPVKGSVKGEAQSQPQRTSAPPEQSRGRQQKVGRVTSDKMQKTIVVAVESLKRHPIYKRTYKYTKKFKAHDEHNDARIGDTVRIEETRPLSKEKRWRLMEILKRAEQTIAPEIIEERLEQQEGLAPGAAGVGEGAGR